MNTSPSSRIPARVPLLLLVALVGLTERTAPPARGESRIWTEPVQVSQTDSAAAGGVMLAPNPPFMLHLAFAEENHCGAAPGYACEHVKAGHLTVGANLLWDWSTREYYTYTPVTGYTGTTDASGAVDDSGTFHVAYETWETQEGNEPDIGYKVKGTPRWAASQRAYRIGDAQSCNTASPVVFIEDAHPADILHVLYAWGYDQTDSACSDHHDWLVHRTRSLADPGNDSTWSTGTFATNTKIGQREAGRGPVMVVDGSGVVHLFGKRRVRYAEADSIWMLHVYGTPPASGEWSTEIDTLDSFARANPVDPVPAYSDVAATFFTSAERSVEVIDVVWTHFDSDDPEEIRETWFARITPGVSDFEGPFEVTPDDGISSIGLALAHTEDERVHLMFQEELAGPRVFYTYSDDPTTEGSWSVPEPVAPDMQTGAHGASFVAIDDSLWTVYHSSDDASGSDGGKADIWFRKGVKMASSQVPSGTTTTWAGFIYLDRDVLVAAGGTLIIQPGTVVVAAAVDSANVGRDSGKVELIVRGTLQVNGETNNRVQFKSVNGSQGGWGGILFDQAAVGTYVGPGYAYGCASFINNATVEDGTSGIAIRQKIGRAHV